MFKRNTRLRTPVELASKWRLQGGAPEVQARTPNSAVWQAAARGADATGPGNVVQAGLQALRDFASQAPTTSGGIVPEPHQGPRDVAGAGIDSGTGGLVEEKPGRGRGTRLPHYPETRGPGRREPDVWGPDGRGGNGGPGGGAGGGNGGAASVFTQAGGLLVDLLQMAKARGAFAEQESVFRQEALARQGQAALGLKAEAGRWYEQLGRKLGGEITHPGLRQDFMAYAQERAQSGQTALHSHETAQADALRRQALAHAPALAARNAALWNTDPEQVERELNNAAWTVRMLGPDDPGEREAMLRTATQRVLGRAIETRAAEPDPDPAGARTLMERWRDRLDEAEAARLEGVFSTMEQKQRRASAWDELAPDVRHDADMAALHGRFGDPDFIGRHGLDANDAAQLAGRLDVAHAAAARAFAREQAEGLARETEDFWTAASQDPLTAYDRLQTAAFLPQEQRDFLRQTLLDPTWDGVRREYAPPASMPGAHDHPAPRNASLPDPRHPGRDPNVRTLEDIPGRDDASQEANLFLPYSPGLDDAHAMLAADQLPQAQQPPAKPQAPAEPGASAEPGALAETDPSQSGNVQAPIVHTNLKEKQKSTEQITDAKHLPQDPTQGETENSRPPNYFIEWNGPRNDEALFKGLQNVAVGSTAKELRKIPATMAAAGDALEAIGSDAQAETPDIPNLTAKGLVSAGEGLQSLRNVSDWLTDNIIDNPDFKLSEEKKKNLRENPELLFDAEWGFTHLGERGLVMLRDMAAKSFIGPIGGPVIVEALDSADYYDELVRKGVPKKEALKNTWNRSSPGKWINRVFPEGQ